MTTKSVGGVGPIREIGCQITVYTAEEEAAVRRATSVRPASVGPERNLVAVGVVMVAMQDPTTGQERSGTTKRGRPQKPTC